ncbi:MAG: TetR/AcrR family transcriptional regulator [Candidatus Izemoplasma sp.]|nr:TetR/AcrR family transcriptional regulator [Candidatus Izemoplasma sp.]
MFQNEKEDVRVRYTREWTFEALHQLLKSKKVSSITISQLIDKAGISRATFYRHFHSMTDVVEAKILSFFSQLYDDLVSLYSSDMPEDEQYLIRYFFEKINQEKEMVDVVLKTKCDYMMVNGILKLITYFKDQFYPIMINNTTAETYTLEIVASSAWTLLSRWHKRGKQEAPNELATIYSQTFRQVSMALFENRHISR